MRSSRSSTHEFPFPTVLILTQYYHPEPGATQIRLQALAKELRAAGVNVRVLTGMPNYPLGRLFRGYRGLIACREEMDGIPIHRLWLYPAGGRGSVRRLLNYISFALLAGLVLLFTRRVSLVFVEAQPVFLAFPAWLLKLLRGIPYVYNTPDLQIEIAEEAQWIRSRTAIRLAVWLESFLMHGAFTVTTVTRAFIDHFVEYRNMPCARMSFLPNGADTDALKPLPPDEAFAESLGVQGRTVFTFAGTHAHYQGLEILIETAERLRHRQDIALLMVGQGPVRATLIEMAQQRGLQNVLFRDSPFCEMDKLMSVTYASLVVLRNLPAARKMRLSKAIPPLACGVPVIIASRGETAQIFAREGCGIAVEPERPDFLAAAIEALADNRETREQMGCRARALAVRDFSWRSLVRDWMSQVQRIKTGASAAEQPG